MTIHGMQKTIENVRKQIDCATDLSPSLKAAIELLIEICLFLVTQQSPKNSSNSSVPPSADPNRKKSSRSKSSLKPGGQPKHSGTTLNTFENPDKIIPITIDRTTLPKGKWKSDGFEKRQVIDIEFKRVVIEYQAEILVNEHGKRVTASFPENVVQTAQYGDNLKAQVVEMSVYQLVPCKRVSEYFAEQLQIPLSPGSVCNFRTEIHDTLLGLGYEDYIKIKLQNSPVLNLDETGINIESKRVWLHTTSTPSFTYYVPHKNRGLTAMESIGILNNTKAVLVHDHWKPYYSYTNHTHALCNAHHLRELQSAIEDGQSWAKRMTDLLLELNKQVIPDGVLDVTAQMQARARYHQIVIDGEGECPEKFAIPPDKRVRIAQTKSRNLLVRFRDFKDDVLRFTTNVDVPFTNNLAERDLRMIKVHQKISGCFRSWDGAKEFCLIRGYISTCAKNGLSAADALKLLNSEKLPDFITTSTTH
jgi:transposase